MNAIAQSAPPKKWGIIPPVLPEVRPPFAAPAPPPCVAASPFGSGPPAARLFDPVSHLSMLAKILAGLAAVATVVAIGVAIFAIGVTGPVGLLVVGGLLAAGGAIGSASVNAIEEKADKELEENKESKWSSMTTPTGSILKGSKDVSTNKLESAHAKKSEAACSQEKKVDIKVGEASDSVFINMTGAARKGDKLVCGAAISGPCSPDVFIGGGTHAYLKVADDLAFWKGTYKAFKIAGAVIGVVALIWAGGAAFIAGGYIGLGTFGLNVVGGMLISKYVLTPVGTFFGGGAMNLLGAEEGSATEKLGETIGSELTNLIPFSIFGKSPKASPGSSKKPWTRQIELNLDGNASKLFQSATGKPLELPAGLRAWNESATAKTFTTLHSGLNKVGLTGPRTQSVLNYTGINQAMARSFIMQALANPKFDAPDLHYTQPDPIVITMKDAGSTGFKPNPPKGSGSGGKSSGTSPSPDISTKTSTGQFRLSGKGSASQSSTPDPFNIRVEYDIKYTIKYDSKLELASIKPPKSPSSRTSTPAVKSAVIKTKAEFEAKYGAAFENQAKRDAGWKVYQEASNPKSELVMGRLDDTQAGAELGMQRLNTKNWSLQGNDAWVQGAIDAKQPIYLGSEIKIANLRTPPGDPYPTTVFMRELKQLRDAGYWRKGDYMMPPPKPPGP